MPLQDIKAQKLALEKDPGNVKAAMDLVAQCLQEGEYWLALEVCQDSLDYHSDTAIRNAFIQHLKEHFPKIEPVEFPLRRSAEIMSNHSQYKHILTILHSQKTNQQKLHLTSDQIAVLHQRGKMLREFGNKRNQRDEEVLGLYEKLIEINPNDTEALSVLANSYRLKKQWIDAAKLYQKILTINPQNIEISNKLHSVFYELGRFTPENKAMANQIHLSPERWKEIIKILTTTHETKESENDTPKNTLQLKLESLYNDSTYDPFLILSTLLEYTENNKNENHSTIMKHIQQIPELVCFIAGQLDKKPEKNISNIEPTQLLKLIEKICPPEKMTQAFLARRQAIEKCPIEKELILKLYHSASQYVRNKKIAFRKSGMERGERLIRILSNIITSPSLNMDLIVDTLATFIKANPKNTSLYIDLSKELIESTSFMICLKNKDQDAENIKALLGILPKIPLAATEMKEVQRVEMPNFFRPSSEATTTPKDEQTPTPNSPPKSGHTPFSKQGK